jgi:formate hydrogenlyase subunit 4
MLKEIAILLAENGCIFLLFAAYGSKMYSSGITVEFILILSLFAILLIFSIFHVKKLLDNKQNRRAVCFSFIQAVTIILSFYYGYWVTMNYILFTI